MSANARAGSAAVTGDAVHQTHGVVGGADALGRGQRNGIAVKRNIIDVIGGIGVTADDGDGVSARPQKSRPSYYK